jgi:hypothetical protein
MERGPFFTVGATVGTIVLLLAGAPAVVCFGMAVVSAMTACYELEALDPRR